MTVKKDNVGEVVAGFVSKVALKVNEERSGSQSRSVTVGFRIEWKTSDGKSISEVYYTHGAESAILSNWHIEDFRQLEGKDAVGKVVKTRKSDRVVEVGFGRNKKKVVIPAERDHLVLLSELKVGYG